MCRYKDLSFSIFWFRFCVASLSVVISYVKQFLLKNSATNLFYIFRLLKRLYFFQEFINKMRILIIEDSQFPAKERYLFTSSRHKANFKTSPTNSNLVSSCLTSTFTEAGVYDINGKYNRVSPTRIRASVATELAGLGGENLKVMAQVHMNFIQLNFNTFLISKLAN